MAQGKTNSGRFIRTKDATRRNYDRLAQWYDLLSERSERDFREAGLRMLAVAPGERILEIGYGTGHAIQSIAHSVGSLGQAYGVDISPKMRSIAEARINAAGFSGFTTLECYDASSLRYSEEYFDGIFMSFTLELFDISEIPLVLAECRRVLRTHGRICVVSLSKEKKTGMVSRLYELARALFPRIVDCMPIDLESYLSTAGFQMIREQAMRMWGLPVKIVLARKGKDEVSVA